MSSFARSIAVVGLLIVGFSGAPFLIGGIPNHKEVPDALLIVLAIAGVAIIISIALRPRHQ